MDKKQLLTMLKNEFALWEELLASLSEEQITAPELPSELSIKDVIAHLWLWQQRSIERLEAALQNREPAFPGWPEGLNPESEDDVDQVNAWIHDTCRDKPWQGVYQDWREGFLRCLELGEAVPEKDLLEAGKYPWMEGGPLALVLFGSYDHHHREHLEPLLAWLGQANNPASKGVVEYVNPDGLLKNPAFSQLAVVSGPVKTVYIGMQNAVDASGNIIGKGDIAAQTEQVLKNIEICLEAAGAKPKNIIQWHIYVAQGQPIQPAFIVGQRWWGNRPNPPLNSVIIVAGFTPPDFLVGIDAIAVVPV